MATIVLGVVGSFFGPVGTAIGAAIGGYIDRQFLFPALFGEPDFGDFSGPRLDDFRLQTASEGSNINFCFGPLTRVAGTLLWFPKVEERQTTEGGGGGKGGGGGPSFTTFTYLATVAIGVCMGPIVRIKKIWADGKIVFNIDADTQVSAKAAGLKIYSGTNLIFDSFTDGVVQEPQDADVAIEAVEGVGEVPPFRMICYIVWHRFEMTDYGNRLPTFTFLVEERSALVPVSIVILQVIGLSKMSPGVEIAGVSTLQDTYITGYTFSGPTRLDRALEPLMLAFDLDVRDQDGILEFFRKSQEGVSRNVLEVDIAAREQGQESPSQLSLTDLASFDLPSEVIVNFIEEASKFQRGSQRERLINWTTRTVRVIDLPITMTAGEARDIAKTRLWRAWNERRTGVVTLPPSYLTIREADQIQINLNGQGYVMRVAEVSRGHNYVITAKGVITGVTPDPSSLFEEPPPPDDDEPYSPPEMVLLILQVAALRDADATNAGYYFAMAALDPEAQYAGSGLFQSLDNVSYSQLATIPWESSIGFQMTMLGNGVAYQWDRVNEFEIEMYQSTLESVTEQQCLDGANRMLVGEELIGFQNAELMGENPLTTARQYKLSKLLRGLRDTEQHMNSHVVNEKVVWLLQQSIGFVGHSLAKFGETRYWKGVAVGGAVEDVLEQSDVLKAQTLVPFAPVHFKGIRGFNFDSTPLTNTDDVKIKWIRRTRAITRLFNLEIPVAYLDGDFPQYEIDVFDAADVLLNTYVIFAEEEFIYNEAQQVVDGLTPGDVVKFQAFQRSPLIGRGKGSEIVTIA